MLTFKMTYYCHKLENGNIEVQNAIMGQLGQNHTHTPRDFEEWQKDIPNDQIEWLARETK